MKDLLKQYFGFDSFRPLQEEIINWVLSGRDACVLMPTGGGKSLCFQIPALQFGGITLVISPLIALMKDQVDGLRAQGIKAEFINSSLSDLRIAVIEEKLLNNQIDLLYIAPERLAVPSFAKLLRKLRIDLIAIDEAHCISEWGHDFRPDYRNLTKLKQTFQVPIIALTATATLQVQKDICKQLSLRNHKLFQSSFNRENLEIQVVRKKGMMEQMVPLLEKVKGESVIVYCFSRKDTEKIADQLNENGFNAKPYHAGLDDQTRRSTQELFVRDEVDIIVATLAFGMGIDKPDVRMVIHTTFPKSLESYYQEIGRAGRDGLPSQCVLFYTYADKRKHQYFINMLGDAAAQAQSERTLQRMVDFCELLTCRRRFIIRYFGEEMAEENCKNCDRCLADEDMFDATEIVQKILSCVVRLESRFGKNYVLDILKGKSSEKVVERGHEKLSVFGIVEDYSRDNVSQIIDALLALDYLERTQDEYPVVRITQKGEQFLMQRASLNLPRPQKSLEKVTTKKAAPRKDVYDYDEALFQKLRALRKEIADELEVPPFVIFGDISLKAMAEALPCDDAAFLEIHGVGDNKLERFGVAFMDVIRVYVDEVKV